MLVKSRLYFPTRQGSPTRLSLWALRNLRMLIRRLDIMTAISGTADHNMAAVGGWDLSQSTGRLQDKCPTGMETAVSRWMLLASWVHLKICYNEVEESQPWRFVSGTKEAHWWASHWGLLFQINNYNAADWSSSERNFNNKNIFALLLTSDEGTTSFTSWNYPACLILYWQWPPFTVINFYEGRMCRNGRFSVETGLLHLP